MRKIVCLFLAVLMVFSMNTFVFATEVNDGGNTEASTSSELVDDPVDLDDEPDGTDNGGESPTETGSGYNGGSGEDVTESTTSPSEPADGSTEPSEPLKVDLTDNSIQAIADAVSTDGNTLTVSNKEGTLITVPEEVAAVWGDFEYKAYTTSGSSSSIWFLSNSEFTKEPYTAQPSYSNFVGNGNVYFYSFSSLDESYTSVDSSFTRFKQAYRHKTVLWANFDILDENGSIYYSSDVRLSYNISFVTGFDDLIIDSQIYGEDFVYPKPEYDGYIFEGWFYESTFENEYILGSDIYSDITLYAKWVEAPPFSFISQNIFDSLIEFLSSGPIFYIVSLMGLLCVIAFIKMLITTRA